MSPVGLILYCTQKIKQSLLIVPKTDEDLLNNNMETKKICKQCKVELPISDFYLNHAKCKSCFLKHRGKFVPHTCKKICADCGVELTPPYRRYFGARCRLCYSAYRRKYKHVWRQSDSGQAYMNRQKKQHAEYRLNTKKSVLQSFNSTCCSQCGESRIVCLDFHHIAGKKEHNITAMIDNHHPLPAIIEEAKKCIVLCSNCHRAEHWGDEWKRTQPMVVH
jgi:hypothetical protein